MSESAQRASSAPKQASAAGRRPPHAVAPVALAAGPASAFQALQAGAGNRAASIAALGAGVPLPAHIRAEMEARFGEHFADVRVHDDTRAHASAAGLRAKAYTHGRDIVFGANRFAPHTGPGKQLLAHELAHVVQQRRGGPAPVLDGGAPHEAAADRAAGKLVSSGAPVVVAGGTAVGVAREEDKDAGPSLLPKTGNAFVDTVIRTLALPSLGVNLASAAVRGMAEQMFRELAGKDWGGQGKGAVLLGRIATMGPKDVLQLAKGFNVGVREGLASPLTDLFGLMVFGEKIKNMVHKLGNSVFASHADLSAELDAVLHDAKEIRSALKKAWKGMTADPAATLKALLSLPASLSALAEQKAYQLGKQGGSAIVSDLESPWSEGKEEEHESPSLLDSPLAWVESKAKAAESWLLDAPWSRMGAKIGYAVGFVAIQVILLLSTGGVGNAVEKAAAALGELGGMLGKLSKAAATAASRMAEIVGAIGRGIALVEEAVAQLVGKLLKPLAKLLEPVLEPFGRLLTSVRNLLRKLLGSAEREGAQLLDKAAAKTAAAAEKRLAPKHTPHAAPGPHAKPAVTGAGHAGAPPKPAPAAGGAAKAGGAGKPNVKPSSGGAPAAGRTPDDEFNDFLNMLKEEGATEFKAAGEPVSMLPHGGARKARRMLGVGGNQESMHGMPQAVGKHLPGYDPKAALTTLGDRASHSAMDKPWKEAFMRLRRQGRVKATAQEVYDAVADSIAKAPHLSPGMKETLKLRLHDEMFVEYGLQPGQELPLPYPSIKAAPKVRIASGASEPATKYRIAPGVGEKPSTAAADEAARHAQAEAEAASVEVPKKKKKSLPKPE